MRTPRGCATREGPLITGKYLSSKVGNWLARVLHLPKKPVAGIAVTF